jgi:hypothetical protein
MHAWPHRAARVRRRASTAAAAHPSRLCGALRGVATAHANRARHTRVSAARAGYAGTAPAIRDGRHRRVSPAIALGDVRGAPDTVYHHLSRKAFVLSFPARRAAIALAALLALTACGDSKPRHTAQPTPAAAVATAATAGTDASAATAAAGARTNATAALVASPTPGRQPAAAAARSTPAAAGPDPCVLVTQAEAEAVLGGPAGGPRTRRTALLSQCQYAPATPSADPDNTVTVQVFPSGGPTTWQLRRDTFRKTDPTVQAVVGVGDEAFWVGDQRALFVTSRGVIFAVRVPGGGPAALANAKALALKAVARLG